MIHLYFVNIKPESTKCGPDHGKVSRVLGQLGVLS